MEYRLWAQELSEKIKSKMSVVTERNLGRIPYSSVDGRFDDQRENNICWWTNGFWGGIMWQLYNATKDEMYRSTAEFVENELDRNLMTHWGMDHDSGFRWLPTAVANFRLTGSSEAYNRGRLAADNLAGRFNPAGSFIRAWNDSGDGSTAGWAIIDCMMNLPLLYWAYRESSDYRYMHIARRHADTAMKHFIRPDGSARHIVEFDPVTGEYVREYGGQGYADGSAWTRGQAWAIYGFALSSRNTGEREYLDCAKRVADYFVAHIPASGFVPIDFLQPADCTLEDSTAAAIAACGMLQIAELCDGDEAEKYRSEAVKILRNLAAHRCRFDTGCDYIVEKCSEAFHRDSHEFSIIYGDYFFIEAIWKLTGEELFIW